VFLIRLNSLALFKSRSNAESENVSVGSLTSRFLLAAAESVSTVASMASTGLLLSWAVIGRRCDENSLRWLFHRSRPSCLNVAIIEIFSFRWTPIWKYGVQDLCTTPLSTSICVLKVGENR
jgi:hypothetical protein